MASQDEQSNVGGLEKLYKVSQVAALFNVTDATVREWLKTGVIRGIKIGQGYYWRIPASAVEELATTRYGDTDA